MQTNCSDITKLVEQIKPQGYSWPIIDGVFDWLLMSEHVFGIGILADELVRILI